MRRSQRIQSFWNWIPAFRAVAEAEHLPTAARELFVTPPALSRTIRLIEEELGQPLFERVGRRISLNSAGQELLRAAREAMRRLDDSVQTISGTRLAGRYHVAAPMPFHSLLVLPAMLELKRDHPELAPELSSTGAEQANQALLDGSLDIALLDDPAPHDELLVERLAAIGYGVYCGTGHPLYGEEAPSIEALSRHPFAAPPTGDDHWPPELSRCVELRLSHLYLGVEACASGHYLAVLPDPVARHHPLAARLRRLPFALFGDTGLYVVRRRPLSDRTAEELVIAVLRRRMTSLMESSRHGRAAHGDL